MPFTAGCWQLWMEAPFPRLRLLACWAWASEVLPPCMLGQGIRGSALILGPDCSQNQAMEDWLKSTLHQSHWGLWSYPQHPPLPCPLGCMRPSLCHLLLLPRVRN